MCHVIVLSFVVLLTVYVSFCCFCFQGYTNTDNPFGDAHLLETFVWQKVHVFYQFSSLYT